MIDTTSLSRQVENTLRDEILSGKLTPGQRIGIDELAARWGVSSTPVRDAVKRLEQAGFIEISPRRGVNIAQLDCRTFKHVFDLRIALECLAVESATERIPLDEIEDTMAAYRDAEAHFRAIGDRALLAKHDDRVHDLIVRYCDNPKLIEIVSDLHDLIAWARKTIVTRQPSTYERAVPEHLAILTALRERDADAAQAALRSHLKRALNETLTPKLDTD
jgi:DNA-binding GntR family transcriptional regulator